MSGKKKVVVFIDWYLPGFKAGGPIQSCANMVDHLAPEFDFYIVTRDTDYCEALPYVEIKSKEWNTLENGSKVYYASKDQLSLSFIKKICCETDFDVAYINGVYSFYFSILPLYFLRNSKNKKIVVATRGMLAQSAINVKKVKKSLFLFVSKMLGLYKHCIFQASTSAEMEDIKKAIGNDAYIILAGNLSKKAVNKEFHKKHKEKGSIHLINIARIAPEKNLLFALEILSEVKAQVSFDFYGPVYDAAYFEKCKQLITQLPSNIKVNYKNSIESSKVNTAFSEQHALFMPTRGENFGHIILESFIASCPVVISDQTPWKDLTKRFLGFDCNLDDKEKFISAIEFMANMNQEEYTSWSQAAYEFGHEYVNNAEILKQNLNLFRA
jgi:glycosyltransferase involved in cell wall biosynthesis